MAEWRALVDTEQTHDAMPVLDVTVRIRGAGENGEDQVYTFSGQGILFAVPQVIERSDQEILDHRIQGGYLGWTPLRLAGMSYLLQLAKQWGILLNAMLAAVLESEQGGGPSGE